MSPGPLLLLAGFVAWLAGCAGGPAPRHHYYRLEPPGPEARLDAPALDGVLVVERLRAEAIASGRELLERSASSPELKPRPYHHWVEPPPTMLQVAIVGYLRDAGVARRVVTPELHLGADYELAGRILAFERVVGSGAPRVRVALELSLVEGRKLRLLETYREEREAAGPGVDDAARAFAEALSSILGRLVAELATAPGAG